VTGDAAVSGAARSHLPGRALLIPGERHPPAGPF